MAKHLFGSFAAKLHSIDKSFLAFVEMNACFGAFITIITLFINTFLLKASSDSSRVMIYNIILGAAQPIAMVGTVFFLRKTSPAVSQRVGFLLYGAAFAAMALLGERAADYYWAIGILLASAAGFYYVTYVLQMVSYTNDANLDTSTGLINTVGSVIGLVLPVLAGVVLSLFSSFTGYRILFLFSLALAALALFFSTKQAPLNQFDNSRKVCFGEVLRALLSDRMSRSVMLMTVFSGIREGTFAFLITMLIYQFIASEAVIGLNSTLCSICGIFSAGLYGYFITPKRRGKSVLFAVAATGFAIALLYLKLDTATLIAFSLVNSLLGTFLATPQTNAYFSVLQHLDSIQGKGAEVHTVREFFYAAGRVTGILILMAMPADSTGYVTAMLILTLAQLVPAFIVSRTQKKLNLD